MAFRQYFLKKIRYTRSDQKSSTKKSTKIYIAPLAQGTEPKKSHVPYNTGRHHRVILSFVLALRVFCRNKFLPKESPLICLEICDRLYAEKSQKVPRFIFLAL